MPLPAAAPCGWRGVALMPDLARLAAMARGLLPPGVAVAAADPRQLYPLLAGEALPGAVPARLREFSAGRHAARAAMAALDAPIAAIPPGDDRAPIWPAGVTGSITHSAQACLAAVARQGLTDGLGLDLEEDAPLEAALWPEICRPEELARLGDTPGLQARLIFAVKEAAYKAQYVRSATLFGFDGLSVTLTDGGFSARFIRPVAPFAADEVLQGKWARAEGHVLVACLL